MTAVNNTASRRSSYLVGKAFRSFLLASVLTAAASQVGNLIDGLMLSHFIGENAMSAINITTPVTQTMFAICILIGVGGSMLAGMAIGNHRRDEASGIFSMVATSAVVIGLIIGSLGMVFFHPLISTLCPDTALMGYTGDYLQIVLPSAAIYMLMVVVQMFVTLDGEPKRVTAALTTCTVVNLSLDYVFIVPLKMGVTGAGIATVVSYVAAITVLLLHFRKEGTLRYTLPRQAALIKSIATMGLPFGIATVLVAVQMLGNNLVAINLMGTAGIVALSVCMYLLRFSMIILTGTLESFQPVAAILKGSGDNGGVSLVLGKAYGFLAFSLTLFALIMILFPGWIISLFDITDPDSMDMMHSALPAFAFNVILQAVVYLLIPVYQLYSHRKLALVISFGQPLMPLVCFWALTTLSAHGCGINPWWGFALGQLLVAVIVYFCTLSRRHDDSAPFVLIPRANPDRIFDTTVKPDFGSMQEGLKETDEWLKRQGVGDEIRNRVVLAMEESVKNVIQHGLSKRRKSAIDVRISLEPDSIRYVLNDEGVPFNPMTCKPDGGYGLTIVQNICDDVKYEYLFHQNILQLEWKRH